jgi:hypothetical protein
MDAPPKMQNCSFYAKYYAKTDTALLLMLTIKVAMIFMYPIDQ